MTGRKVAEVPLSSFHTSAAVAFFEYRDRLGLERQGLVIRVGSEYVALENRCPHWSAPLLRTKNEDVIAAPILEGEHVICPWHGARFVQTTGACVEGPCVGESIDVFDVVVYTDRLDILRRSLLRV